MLLSPALMYGGWLPGRHSVNQYLQPPFKGLLLFCIRKPKNVIALERRCDSLEGFPHLGAGLRALSIFSGIFTGARLGLGLLVSTLFVSNVTLAIPASGIRPSRITFSTRRLFV